MEKADHTGHRDRLRKKYAEFGIDALSPHEVLEMLLYYAIPRRNTNDIAKRLLDSFGSVSGVLDASAEMLTEEGLSVNQALFLKMIPDVMRLYQLDKYENPARTEVNALNMGQFLIKQFIGLEGIERVVVLLFDIKGKMVFCGKVSDGEFNISEISKRKILRLALNYNAASVVLAHNHPSGLALPSKRDVESTLRIQEMLESIGVELLDHYIIADHDAVSMALSGLLDE